jgi:hypothetical protein
LTGAELVLLYIATGNEDARRELLAAIAAEREFKARLVEAAHQEEK